MANYPTEPNGPGGRFSANQAVERGASQLGLPYIWGGVAPGRGFDCSGFVSWCYFGKRLFTSANADSELAKHAFHPGSSSYEKGDVVFFKNDPGHVGIFTGDEAKRYGGGGPVLQSQGGRGVCFGGHCGWTHVMRPDEGFGIYIDHFS